eukprot:TRINITY_DN3869_c0_g1_i2.p1 TRINITY_DN3869_c0_g1~~TRINITY_DN3869_c0_g1_i2.p1  ORF type:complete len:295 (+),score=50.58 TRINITY_DN3869_c0_g1_i2:338-1222(+)
MIGSQAVVGWSDLAGGGHVAEFALTGHSVDAVQPSSDLSILATAFTWDAGIVKVQFQLPWNQLAEKYLARNGYSSLIFAYGTSTFPSKHIQKVVMPVEVNFATGEYRTKWTFLQIHGIVMATAWALIFPFGVLFARYGKNIVRGWSTIHTVGQVTGVLITLTGFVIIMVQWNGSVRADFSDHLHGLVGLITISMISLSAIGGVCHTFKSDDGPTPLSRVLFEVLHENAGKLAWLFAITNIFLGLRKINAPSYWFISYAGLIILTLFLAFLLEIRLRRSIRYFSAGETLLVSEID